MCGRALGLWDSYQNENHCFSFFWKIWFFKKIVNNKVILCISNMLMNVSFQFNTLYVSYIIINHSFIGHKTAGTQIGIQILFQYHWWLTCIVSQFLRHLAYFLLIKFSPKYLLLYYLFERDRLRHSITDWLPKCTEEPRMN